MPPSKRDTNGNAGCVEVVAAIITVGENALLIARKPALPAAGAFWEFPGGKVESQETHTQALVREIDEELGVEIAVGQHFQTVHVNKRSIRLAVSFYFAQIKRGIPEPKVHTALQIIRLDELRTSKLPRFHKADRLIVHKLLAGARITS